VPPAAGARPAKPNKGAQPARGTQPFHKQPGFKDRLVREAENRARKMLGMTLEEAKAALSGRPAPAAAPAPAPGAPAPAATPPRASKDPDEKLRRQLEDKTSRVERQSEKIKKLKTKHADELVNLGMRHEALAVGIAEEHVDFALKLYTDALLAWKRNQDPKKGDIPESRGFFAGLRTARAYLFREGAPIVDLRPTTAPPESTAPGGETPTPARPGTPPKKPDAMDMDEDQWRAHKRRLGIPGLG
jgi:DNA-binding transcriptional MerR regulator